MPVPENAEAIWDFLIGKGFNENAAAGILGNIEQESGGNPAAPGGGLIQILQGNPGYTSNTSLSAQMNAMMTYILANGSVSDINAHATTPQAAALYFSEKYERPGIPDNQNRMDSAAEVLAAAQSGKWPQGSGGTTTAGGATATGALFTWPSDITSFFDDAKTMMDALMWLVNPASWLRIGSFFAGAILLCLALYVFIKADSGEPIMPRVVPIPV